MEAARAQQRGLQVAAGGGSKTTRRSPETQYACCARWLGLLFCFCACLGGLELALVWFFGGGAKAARRPPETRYAWALTLYSSLPLCLRACRDGLKFALVWVCGGATKTGRRPPATRTGRRPPEIRFAYALPWACFACVRVLFARRLLGLGSALAGCFATSDCVTHRLMARFHFFSQSGRCVRSETRWRSCSCP